MHWVKQRHTRTVLYKGEARQKVVTERIIMHQDGDVLPTELQHKVDQLASDFRDYDLTAERTSDL